MLNKITLIGRVVQELELKKVGGKSVCNFTLAVDRDFSDETDFINVVAWNGVSENLVKYVKKGEMISVHGRLTTRKYKPDWSEKEITVYEVQASEIHYLTSKKNK